MAGEPQARRAPDGRVIAWAPNSAPQRALLACPVFEVFFGGARGGGKTDGMLGEWAQHASQYGKDAIGLMVRRSRVELTETFERAKVILSPIGASFTEVPMRCVMPNGARLTFAYLERDADAGRYQGHNYTRVYVEEAGNFPSPAPIMKLFATLRSGAGVPCRIRLTGNPGGPGHQWVKARYIDPAPLGWSVITDDMTGLERVYIPSRVTDNKALGQGYVNQLKASGAPALVKAWLDGDWNVVAGAYFPEWGQQHIVPTRALPDTWARFRSYDHGTARPFSVGWWAVSDGTDEAFPRGAIIRYREWYGMAPNEPNVGLKMVAEEIADGIKLREAGEKLVYGVADPAIFAFDNGPSVAERMAKRGVMFRRGDNARVLGAGAMSGWDMVRARLKGDDGVPMLYAMDCCRDFIRTMPALQHDPARPEDVDTDGEDHAADEARYGCMSRPWVPTLKSTEPPRGLAVGPTNTLRVNDVFWKSPRRESGRI